MFNRIYLILSYITRNKKQKKWRMCIAKTKHVQLLWKRSRRVTLHERHFSLKITCNWLGFVVSFLSNCCVRYPNDIFFFRKNSNIKNPWCYVSRTEHAKFVLILKCHVVRCRICRLFEYFNIDPVLAQHGKLSAVRAVSYLIFFIILRVCVKER